MSFDATSESVGIVTIRITLASKLVIEQRYELAQIAEAMREMNGHARAKIVVTV